MIISASRRTDIPALYPDWLTGRLREGYALVRNPYNPSKISRVPLHPDVVDCLVFWTKNPGPMLAALPDITRMGYSFYVQYTLTGYGSDLEPGLPTRDKRLDSFRRLVDLVGPERVVWRYDPVILNAEYSVPRHLEMFGTLVERLSGLTRRCVFSFVDLYRKNRKRMRGVVDPSVTDDARKVLAAGMAEMAARRGMTLTACSEDLDLRGCGVERAACIDKELIERIVGFPLRGGKDPNQRKVCGCMESVDIGAYDSCTHLCRYCYATSGANKVENNAGRHDPASPLILGWPDPLAEIAEREAKSGKERQLKFV